MDGFLEPTGMEQASLRDRLSLSEVEISFLGTVILTPNVFDRVQWLSPDDFSGQIAGILWDVMRTLRSGSADAQFDPVIVAPRLIARGLPEQDAKQFVAKCAASGMSASQAQYYAQTIRDLAQRRRFLDLAMAAIDGLDDLETPGNEMFGKFSGELQSLLAGDGRKVQTKKQVIEGIADGLSRQLPVYPTGINALDASMGGGMYAGRLYGFAARKKVGKSVLLGTISHNLDKANVPHLVIAMETPASEMEQRNIAFEGKFNSIHFLRRNNPTLDDRVRDIAKTAGESARYFDAPGADWDTVRAEIMREIVAHGIKGVILDYWQLVQGKSGKDTEEFHLRVVAQGLADICRREGIFLAIAAQVNQDGNTRGGEGLKLACDQYYTLHREKDSKNAWLEMEESRYTIYQNVGTEVQPGVIMSSHGPAFVDAGYVA